MKTFSSFHSSNSSLWTAFDTLRYSERSGGALLLGAKSSSTSTRAPSTRRCRRSQSRSSRPSRRPPPCPSDPNKLLIRACDSRSCALLSCSSRTMRSREKPARSALCESRVSTSSGHSKSSAARAASSAPKSTSATSYASLTTPAISSRENSSSTKNSATNATTLSIFCTSSPVPPPSLLVQTAASGGCRCQSLATAALTFLRMAPESTGFLPVEMVCTPASKSCLVCTPLTR